MQLKVLSHKKKGLLHSLCQCGVQFNLGSSRHHLISDVVVIAKSQLEDFQRCVWVNWPFKSGTTGFCHHADSSQGTADFTNYFTSTVWRFNQWRAVTLQGKTWGRGGTYSIRVWEIERWRGKRGIDRRGKFYSKGWKSSGWICKYDRAREWLMMGARKTEGAVQTTAVMVTRKHHVEMKPQINNSFTM